MIPLGSQDEAMSQVRPVAPAPPPAQLSGLFSMMADLSSKPKDMPADKIKRAISILDEVRDEDEKTGEIASMAIHVLRNGPSGLEKFGVPSSPNNTRRSR